MADVGELAVQVSLPAQLAMTVAEFRAALPAARHRRELLYLVEQHQVVVAVGQTGSGKTTQLPQYLHAAGWTSEARMIACTQVARAPQRQLTGASPAGSPR